jgi:hypothetical protein
MPIHFFSSDTRTFILVVGIGVSLVFYFLLSIYIFPNMYRGLPKLKPIPLISNVTIYPSTVHLGNTFDFNVVAENAGDNADIQIISIAFPNMTHLDGLVGIKRSDFTQKPVFIKVGDKVGSDYVGEESPINARYASLEFFSRPWHPAVIHHLQLQIRPDIVGKFVIFLKAIALPHLNDFAHYPRRGIKDFQNEFVSVYSLRVAKIENVRL